MSPIGSVGRSVRGRRLPDAIPDSGGDHQWNFEEGSATNVKDSIGSLDAPFTDITWESGAGAGDVHGVLDGTDDYANLGTQSAFTHLINDGVGSVAWWVKIDSDSDQYAVLGTQLSEQTTSFGFWVDTGSPKFTMSDGSGAYAVDVSGGSFAADMWHMMGARLDGDECHIYADGELVVSETIDNTTTGEWATYNVHIGAFDGGSNRLYGGGIDIGFVASVDIGDQGMIDWYNDTEGLF